jgi:hypothetical protein
MSRIETKHLFSENTSPNIKRIVMMKRSGIPISKRDEEKLKRFSESVSMTLPPPKHERDRVQKSMIWNGNDISDIEDEDEVDLDEILHELGYYDEEEDESDEEDIREMIRGMVKERFHENMSDIPNLTEEELESIINGLEDDSVNEFNFNSKGYKEGRKLVDKLRRDLFKKLSDDDLDEFMNVLSNSFDLVRK